MEKTIKKYYNLKNISAPKPGGGWARGAEALDYLEVIREDPGNWDLLIDSHGLISYIAKNPECKSGIWGDTKHYRKKYNEDPKPIKGGKSNVKK